MNFHKINDLIFMNGIYAEIIDEKQILILISIYKLIKSHN